MDDKKPPGTPTAEHQTSELRANGALAGIGTALALCVAPVLAIGTLARAGPSSAFVLVWLFIALGIALVHLYGIIYSITRLVWARSFKLLTLVCLLMIAGCVVGYAQGRVALIRMRCGAWGAMKSNSLRALGAPLAMAHHEGKEPPSPSVTLELALVPDAWQRMFSPFCGSCPLDTPVIAGHTIRDFQTGSVDRQLIESEARRASLANSARWEQVGDYWISHDARIWRTKSSSIIGGFALNGPPISELAIMLADGHIETFNLSGKQDHDAQLALMRAATAAQQAGVSQPPAELFEAVNAPVDKLLVPKASQAHSRSPNAKSPEPGP